jgi:hypothetical protein
LRVQPVSAATSGSAKRPLNKPLRVAPVKLFRVIFMIFIMLLMIAGRAA